MNTQLNALHLIQEAKKNNSLFLDIGNCGLTSLPKELFSLNHLEILNLGEVYYNGNTWIESKNSGKKNKIKDLPLGISKLQVLKKLYLFNCDIENIRNLKNLEKLEEINIDNNNIESVKPLENIFALKKISAANNKISNISVFANLKNLEFLNLSNNKIKDISSLKNLKKLKEVNFWKNQIASISPIKDLKSLEKVSLADNQLDNIDDLEILDKLKCLSLSNNNITDINPIKKLSNLEYLALSNNRIKSIDNTFFENLPNLKELFLFDNPINNIPADALGGNQFDDCLNTLIEEFLQIKIFISCAQEDSKQKNNLLKHLSSLKSLRIQIWDQEHAISRRLLEDHKKKLEESDLILCLISKDYINSELSYNQTIKKIINSQNEKKHFILPIIIEPCYYQSLEISSLKCIPDKPISEFENEDSGWTYVIQEIYKIIKSLKEKNLRTT